MLSERWETGNLGNNGEGKFVITIVVRYNEANKQKTYMYSPIGIFFSQGNLQT